VRINRLRVHPLAAPLALCVCNASAIGQEETTMQAIHREHALRHTGLDKAAERRYYHIVI
jgi:hypothetical protein